MRHCAQEPELDDAQNFSILQPGSSVATALSEGESKRKHVMILEVMGEQWRTVKIALRTVRPFVFESVRLDLGLLRLSDAHRGMRHPGLSSLSVVHCLFGPFGCSLDPPNELEVHKAVNSASMHADCAGGPGGPQPRGARGEHSSST